MSHCLFSYQPYSSFVDAHVPQLCSIVTSGMMSEELGHDEFGTYVFGMMRSLIMSSGILV